MTNSASTPPTPCQPTPRRRGRPANPAGPGGLRGLRALLDARGLSQRAFADLLNVTTDSVSRWVNGRGDPCLATCRRVADALGVEMIELLNPPADVTPAVDAAA